MRKQEVRLNNIPQLMHAYSFIIYSHLTYLLNQQIECMSLIHKIKKHRDLQSF